MKVLVLVNPVSGQNDGATERRVQEIKQALSTAGVEAQMRVARGTELFNAAREAAETPIDALVVAGGDGTVSAVVQALVGTKPPLGILPLGTLNHLAKDLAIPQDLAEAARIIAAGNVRQIDVARVNDKLFVNNSSIGLYPSLVRQREQRQRRGWSKWLALIASIPALLRRFPTLRVHLAVNTQQETLHTPFVFIGNNMYETSLPKLGSRPQLNAGTLCLYYTQRTGRWIVLRLVLRTLLGKLEQDRDFQSLRTDQLWIDSSRLALPVALDGEVLALPTPLRYTILPGALRVLAPPPQSS